MSHDASYTNKQFKLVGTRVPRPDGTDKVTGRARYGADASAPGQLVGMILRSPHAHAEIRKIDVSAAEKLPRTATPAIRTLVREGKTHQLYLDIQTGAELGMQTLDGSLLSLLKQGKIDYEHALAKCSNVQDFVRRATNMGVAEATNAAN